jgi:hypothetical protein
MRRQQYAILSAIASGSTAAMEQPVVSSTQIA